MRDRKRLSFQLPVNHCILVRPLVQFLRRVPSPDNRTSDLRRSRLHRTKENTIWLVDVNMTSEVPRTCIEMRPVLFMMSQGFNFLKNRHYLVGVITALPTVRIHSFNTWSNINGHHARKSAISRTLHFRHYPLKSAD